MLQDKVSGIPQHSVWDMEEWGGVCYRDGWRTETRHRVDELGGNRWTISQCTCNHGWRDVHTNGGNKVLLVKTPSIKMAGPFARRVVGQLEVGHV